jgi:hypothetical protein
MGIGSLVAGPGSDLSEESASGFEPAALESGAAPECPPGPDRAARARASVIICRNTTSDRRRLRARMASIGVLPAATLRS